MKSQYLIDNFVTMKIIIFLLLTSVFKGCISIIMKSNNPQNPNNVTPENLAQRLFGSVNEYRGTGVAQTPSITPSATTSKKVDIRVNEGGK